MEQVHLANIEDKAFRVRMSLSPQDVADLSTSMKNFGQLFPVLLRPHPIEKGKYQLVCGYRRLNAARRLGWSSIHAKVLDADDETAFNLSLIENLGRNDLTDYEKGLLFKRIHELFDKSYEDIGRVIGKTRQYVASHAAMVRLFEEDEIKKNPELLEILQNLTEHHARILLKVRDRNERLQMARMVIKNRLCVKETEKLIGRSWKLTCPPESEDKNQCYFDLSTVQSVNSRLNDTGTRLDFAPSIDQIPLEKLIGTGFVLTVPKRRCQMITKTDLVRQSGETSLRGGIILICTGWETRWGSRIYAYHPYFSVEAMEWLVSQGPKMIGIDTMSVDLPAVLRPKKFYFPAHQKLYEAGIPVLECLVNLRYLIGKRFRVYAIPIKVNDFEEGLARVFAEVVDGSPVTQISPMVTSS